MQLFWALFWLFPGVELTQLNIQQVYSVEDENLAECNITGVKLRCAAELMENLEIDDVEISACLDWWSSKCDIHSHFNSQQQQQHSACTKIGGHVLSLPAPYNILAHALDYKYVNLEVGNVDWPYRCGSNDWRLEITDDPEEHCRDIDLLKSRQLLPAAFYWTHTRAYVSRVVFDLSDLIAAWWPLNTNQTFLLANMGRDCVIQGIGAVGISVTYSGLGQAVGKNTSSAYKQLSLSKGLPPPYTRIVENEGASTSWLLHFTLWGILSMS